MTDFSCKTFRKCSFFTAKSLQNVAKNSKFYASGGRKKSRLRRILNARIYYIIIQQSDSNSTNGKSKFQILGFFEILKNLISQKNSNIICIEKGPRAEGAEFFFGGGSVTKNTLVHKNTPPPLVSDHLETRGGILKWNCPDTSLI